MAFLPESPWALLSLALVLGAVGWITFSRTMPKAYGYGLVALVMFLVQSVEPLLSGTGSVGVELGFTTHGFLRGAWWTPLTYMFVHAGLLHLFGNLLLLVATGPHLEERLGPWGFVLIFLLSGFTGVAAHSGLVALGFIRDGLAVGASGAIFGLLAALAFYWPNEKVPMSLVVFLVWWPAIVVLAVYIAMNVVYALAVPGIAWYGHYAGALAGTILAPVARRTGLIERRRFPDPERLAPLATTAALREILDRLRESSGAAKDDASFSEMWLARFFEKARCPAGHALVRTGLSARCAKGEYAVEFAK